MALNPNLQYLGGSPTFNEQVSYQTGPTDWFSDNQPTTGGVTGGQTGATPQPGTQGDAGMDAFGRAWMASGGRTVDDLKNFVAQHPEYGVSLGGSKGDKVYGPDGRYWADAVIGAGAGGQGASWQTDTGGIGGGAMGSLTAPYTGQFTLPTQAELEAMPGYQAALAAAQKGVERSAAGRGTLLTGGTLQRLQQTGGDVASQMYGQLANLSLGAQQGNYGIFKDNQDRPFDKLYATSQLGLSALNGAANNASTYSTNAQNNAQNTGNAQAAGTVAQNNATTGALGGIADAGMSAYDQWLRNRRIT